MPVTSEHLLIAPHSRSTVFSGLRVMVLGNEKFTAHLGLILRLAGAAWPLRLLVMLRLLFLTGVNPQRHLVSEARAGSLSRRVALWQPPHRATIYSSLCRPCA